MRQLSISDKRNRYTILCKAEDMLQRHKLTLAEYREIEDAVYFLFVDRTTTTTIDPAVADFLSLFGVHSKPHGIGWILSYL